MRSVAVAAKFADRLTVTETKTWLKLQKLGNIV